MVHTFPSATPSATRDIMHSWLHKRPWSAYLCRLYAPATLGPCPPPPTDPAMGESGPIPSAEPAGHRTKAELERREAIFRPAVVDHPPPAERWSLVTRGAWETYWASYVALTVEPIDVRAVVRLFDLMDRQERMWEIVDDETAGTYTVTTEKSGDKAHPLIASIATLDGMIDKLERQFGVRPLSRMRLGLHNAAAQSAQEKAARGSAKRGRVVDNGAAAEPPTPTPDTAPADPVLS